MVNFIIKKRLRSTVGIINHLIRHHKSPCRQLRVNAANSGYRQYLTHTQLREGGDISPVIDSMGRETRWLTMAR